MKIPLIVYQFTGSLRAMARFLLKSQELKIFAFIDAVVDSGSPNTILGSVDIGRIRLSQIQLGKLIGKVEKIGYGGGEIKARTLEKANLRFGNYLNITMPILIPIKDGGKCPQPTILGVDFLLKNKLSFFFDPTNKEAYFETSK